MKEPLPPSPLLQADPSTLPPYRVGTRSKWGGLLAYIRAVRPGRPPLGWRDITPYFGRIPPSLGKWRIICRESGYLLEIQRVTKNGQRYKRVAVALADHRPVTKAIKAARKDHP